MAGKLPQAIRDRLNEAIESCNLDNCGASESAKKEMKTYIDTWIWHPLKTIADYDEGKVNARGQRLN